MSSEHHDLNRLEAWMLAVVSHPDGTRAGIDAAGSDMVDVTNDTLDKIVLRSNNLTAHERIDVYTNMYYWRLVDVLVDDFPATRYAMGGSDAFFDMAVDYLRAHPSRKYRLGPLGAQLSNFIQNQAKLSHSREFLAQLAHLERRMEEVFDEKHQTPVTSLEVQAIPQEQWVDARFRVIDAMRLETFDFPVNDYVDAYKNDEEPSIPGREHTHALIWRLNYDVWRSNLDDTQFTLLSALDRGESLSQAFEACAELPEFDADRLMANLGLWFKEWTEDGLFYAIDLS